MVKVLLTELETGIFQLIINRPESLNALDVQTGKEMNSALDSLLERYLINPLSVRAMILTGTGDRAFCAGVDLKERGGVSDALWFEQHLVFESLAEKLNHLPFGTLAAVNGVAYGGGLELALCCDLITASVSAKFGQPEAKVGIMPGLGGTQRLLRVLGTQRTKFLCLLGAPIDATTAYSWGLIHTVVPQLDLISETLGLARILGKNAPRAISAIKGSIRDFGDLPLNHALEQELVLYKKLVQASDRVEGVCAFLEKRTPHFTGR